MPRSEKIIISASAAAMFAAILWLASDRTTCEQVRSYTIGKVLLMGGCMPEFKKPEPTPMWPSDRFENL